VFSLRIPISDRLNNKLDGKHLYNFQINRFLSFIYFLEIKKVRYKPGMGKRADMSLTPLVSPFDENRIMVGQDARGSRLFKGMLKEHQVYFKHASSMLHLFFMYDSSIHKLYCELINLFQECFNYALNIL
jgi:hypothetical protein